MAVTHCHLFHGAAVRVLGHFVGLCINCALCERAVKAIKTTTKANGKKETKKKRKMKLKK